MGEGEGEGEGGEEAGSTHGPARPMRARAPSYSYTTEGVGCRGGVGGVTFQENLGLVSGRPLQDILPRTILEKQSYHSAINKPAWS